MSKLSKEVLLDIIENSIDKISIPRVTSKDLQYIKKFDNKFDSLFGYMGLISSIIFILISSILVIPFMLGLVRQDIDAIAIILLCISACIDIFFIRNILDGFRIKNIFREGDFECCEAYISDYYRHKDDNNRLNITVIVEVNGYKQIVEDVIGDSKILSTENLNGSKCHLARTKFKDKYRYVVFLY